MLCSNVHIRRIRNADCVEDAQQLYKCIEYEGQQQTVVTVNCGMYVHRLIELNTLSAIQLIALMEP